MNVVLSPCLHLHTCNVLGLLRALVNHDAILHVWLPVTEQGAFRTIVVGESERVDPDSNVCLNLGDYLRCELTVAEETVAQ